VKIYEHEHAKTVKAKPFVCSLKSTRNLDTSCLPKRGDSEWPATMNSLLIHLSR